MGLIENENNLIKYEGKTDLTEVAKQAYDDGGKDIVKELGQVGATVFGFLNNTIGVPFQLYNAWAKPNIEKVKQNIENNLKEIPPQNLTNPPMNILLPAIDGLKYNLDEEDLKKYFENLIVNSCNTQYADIIHPRYVEIIKQLSKDDAIFIKELSSDIKTQFPIATINNKNTDNKRTYFNFF